MSTLDRLKGCAYGQAIGDALGLGAEFMTRAEVEKRYPEGLTDYSQIVQTNHTSRWKRGEWTDDTDMWLCIARSVVDNDGKVVLSDIARRFADWADSEPPGLGRHTRNVLWMRDYREQPLECAEMMWQLGRKRSAPNGALMRTSILAMLPYYQPKMAEEVCRLTHADPRCVGSCVVYCDLVHALIYGKPVPDVNELCAIAERYDPRIVEYVKAAYTGPFDHFVIDDYTMGYTLNTLFVALWAYWHAPTFEDGLLTAINAGGDADTNGAVAASLLGAKFGYPSIPSRLITGLRHRSALDEVINKITAISS